MQLSRSRLAQDISGVRDDGQSAGVRKSTCRPGRSVGRILIVVLSIAGLAACGFHLRGTSADGDPTGWAWMRLACPDAEIHFCNRLRDQLIQSGVQLIESDAPSGESASQAFTSLSDGDISIAGDQSSSSISLSDDQDVVRAPLPSSTGKPVASAASDQTGQSWPTGLESDDDDLPPNPADVPLLTVKRIDTSRRAVTLTATAGAAEYEVSREVLFTLQDANEMRIPPTRIRQFQTYRFDAERILGMEREERQIREELDSQIAFLIVNRVSLDAIKADTLPKPVPEDRQVIKGEEQGRPEPAAP